MLSLQRPIPIMDPEFVLTLFGVPIANSTTLIFIILLLVLVYGVFVSPRFKAIPSKTQLAFEIFYEQTKGLIEQITQSDKHTKRILPLATALFVYLIVTNMITFIPGITSIMVGDVALFRTPTADFNTTFGLAFGVVLLIQIASIQARGIFGYLSQFIRIGDVYNGFKKSIGAGFQSLIDLVMGVLDIIGEIAKIISLSLRLLGNMFAGNVLATILLGSLAIVVPAIWMAVNMFTSLIQALVFVALAAAYYSLAVTTEDADEKEA